MNPLALLLIVAGVAAIAVGAWRMRGPLAAIRRLDATAANLQRYETWRGTRTAVEADGPTGADEMRAILRQRVMLWGALAGAGVILILAGLINL